MKIRNILLAGSLALGAAHGAFAQIADGVPAFHPTVDSAIEFPNPDKATRKQGVFVAPRNVAMVTPGMTKGQIYTLLDVPHFEEGLFGVRRWNYILNFYTGRGDEFTSCQYQIRFDRRARIENTYFRDQTCADRFQQLLTPQPASVAAPAVVAQPAPVLVKHTAGPAKTYSFTFDFNSSHVTGQGMTALREAAAEIGRGHYQEVIITGYTDTVGSVDFNDALAARRAAESARILREMTGSVPIYSRSARDLEIPTTGDVREERNRRVQVDLYETAVDRPAPTSLR